MSTIFLVFLASLLTAYNAPRPLACYDSDGGDEMFVAGSAYYVYADNGENAQMGGLSDQCIIVWGYPHPYQPVSVCRGANCYLNEVNCVNGNPTATNHICPGDCRNGACTEFAPRPPGVPEPAPDPPLPPGGPIS